MAGVVGAVTECVFVLMGGRDWTELAKGNLPAPGFHSFLAPTPVTPSPALQTFVAAPVAVREI